MSRWGLIFIVSSALLIGTASAMIGYNYCVFGDDNTMCKYAQMTTGPGCGERLYWHGRGPLDIANILKLHNDLRKKVANGTLTLPNGQTLPQASNMRRITWSTELSRVAQRWANQCIYDYDVNRKTRRFANAYTLQEYTYVSNADTLYDVRRNWGRDYFSYLVNKDLPNVDASLVNSYDPSKDKTLFFYTAISARTYKVGCGFVRYIAPGGGPSNMYVCNYAPSELTPGMPLYRQGKPATQCPGTTEPHPPLCSKIVGEDQ